MAIRRSPTAGTPVYLGGPAGPQGQVGATGATGASGPQGPTGAAGAAGPPGGTGQTGAAGPAGASGNTLRSGSGAPASGLGNDGDFYVDPTAQMIYGPKASGAWPAGVSYKGATGATGAQGPTGATGSQGATGAQGQTGAQGPTGATGAAGSQGATGAMGASGADGAAWYGGTTAPASGTGKTGDWYINTASGDLYTKSGGSWGSPVINLLNAGGSWTAYTPSVAAGSGSFSSVSATGRYQIVGKRADWQAEITITTNGTAAGYTTITMPAGKTAAANDIFSGRERASTGTPLVGILPAGGNAMTIVNLTNGGYVGGNGYVLTFNGSFECQ